MKDLILAALLLIIIGSAIIYIIRAKRRGAKCIGCPSATTCTADSDAACNGDCSGCQYHG